MTKYKRKLTRRKKTNKRTNKRKIKGSGPIFSKNNKVHQDTESKKSNSESESYGVNYTTEEEIFRLGTSEHNKEVQKANAKYHNNKNNK